MSNTAATRVVQQQHMSSIYRPRLDLDVAATVHALSLVLPRGSPVQGRIALCTPTAWYVAQNS